METLSYILLIMAWSAAVLKMLHAMYKDNYMDGWWLGGVMFFPYLAAIYYYTTKLLGLGGKTWGYKGNKIRSKTRPWKLDTREGQILSQGNITFSVVTLSFLAHFLYALSGVDYTIDIHSDSQYLCDTRLSDKKYLQEIEYAVGDVLGVSLYGIEYIKPAPKGRYWSESAVLCASNGDDGGIHYFVLDLTANKENYTIHGF